MFNENGDTAVASTVKFHAIKVRVTPSGPALPTGEVPCDITAVGNPGGGKVENNRIKLDNGEGPFCLQFDLDRSLGWATEGELIWVKKDACPLHASSEPSQIWVDNTPKNNVLTIMDMNVGRDWELHYRLNFANGQFCDPVIENGGGNIFR